MHTRLQGIPLHATTQERSCVVDFDTRLDVPCLECGEIFCDDMLWRHIAKDHDSESEHELHLLAACLDLGATLEQVYALVWDA